ncbi:MAG: ScpA family protein [Pseudobdellovibrionaceae bacterium]
MSFTQLSIQLSQFEGPLSLLLHLIRKEEMDIFDINIKEITNQYLEYIKLMKELDLEVAGEFVAMAATLMHIKSQMLLPQYNEQGEIVETEDPRRELVQRLLEYQKYQEAAKSLYERPLVGRDTWLRGVRETLKAEDDEIILEDNALFALISTYRNLLKNVKRKIHQVGVRTQSIASRVLEIKDRLLVGIRITLEELITATDNRHRQVLITFLSLLELGKLGFVNLYQNETYGDIHIEAKKEVVEDAISRVEEYDTNPEKSEQIATALMTEVAAEDFVMPDEKDPEEVAETEMPFADAATDEEILAAENELFAHEHHVSVEAVRADALEAVEKVHAFEEGITQVAVEVPMELPLSAPQEEALKMPAEKLEIPSSIEIMVGDNVKVTFVEAAAETIDVTPESMQAEEVAKVEARETKTQEAKEEVDTATANVHSGVMAAMQAFSMFDEPAPPIKAASPESRPEVLTEKEYVVDTNTKVEQNTTPMNSENAEVVENKNETTEDQADSESVTGTSNSDQNDVEV